MRKFLSALLIAGIFLSSSIVHAEVKTYTGKDEYFIGERETIEQAKEHSKTRALRNAREQAGIYIRSRSRSVNLELVEDEILTIAEGVLKIVGTPNFEQRALEGGKGILLITTLTVEIDIEEVNRRLEKFIPQQKPTENVSPPPAVDNIALSKQKIDEARKLCASGDYKAGFMLYDEFIRQNPKEADIFNERGDLAQKICDSGGQTELFSLYDEAINLNPNDAYAFNRRGALYMYVGNVKKALVDFKRAVELEPDAAWHYDCLGWAYNALGKYEKAISLCDKAIELDKNCSWAYHTRGISYSCLRMYKFAIAEYDKSISINPNWSKVYAHRGMCYASLSKWKKAIDDFTKAIESDSKYAKAYYYRGECYQALGEHEKARADFAKARQLGWKG